MAKSKQKIEALILRKSGLSIKTIAKKLDVSVSTVSIWVRNVVLTTEQKKTLENQGRDPYYGARGKYIESVKKKTDKKVERLMKEGTKSVGKLTKRELFLVGVALYWSEGFKKDSQVGFANSDPKMIKLFLRWLFEYFGYGLEDLSVRVTLNMYQKDRIEEVQKWWSEQVNIPLNSFKKPFFQNVLWKKVYSDPENYHGVLRVKVLKSTDFLRKIHGFIDGLRLEAEIR